LTSLRDIGLIQVGVGVAVLVFLGIVVCIIMTAAQNFQCKASTVGAPTSAGFYGNASGDGHVQGLLEPFLPGIMPGRTRPKLVLAIEPNWPPYAFIDPYTGSNDGMAVDMAKGMGELCNLDVVITQTQWTECWVDRSIGRGLLNGDYHACMTYIYSKGARERHIDVSHAFLKDNKPVGLLVRLNEDGTPEIDGNHNLNGKKVVHVNGWAPTEDALGFVVNNCTGEHFSGYEMVASSPDTPNDDALGKLLDGTVDAMWVFVSQSEFYKNAGCIPNNPSKTSPFPDWDCAKWAGFGTKFAFIQTGLFSHAYNGTTLAMSKKGSGLNEIINPCMERYMQTKEYYEVCAKYGLADDCYPNSYFPEEYFTTTTSVWNIQTQALPTQCKDGYCACPL